MERYLLDTNHVSPLITLTHPLRKKILLQVQDGDLFYMPTLVLAEMLFGISILPRAKQNLDEWARLSPIFERLTFGEDEAMQAAQLQTSLRRQGWQLQLVDAIIAVTALRYDLTLLTTDNDFSPIDGLDTNNWID